MAKNDARKSFVEARLKETGKEATPEQRAKFRKRFNTLSQTKEGRTKIAQKVLPGGTAAERATLKKSIRPTQTGTGGSDTGGSTGTGSTTATYNPGIGGNQKTTVVIGGVGVPAGNSASSAAVPSNTTSTTVPSTTTSTTVPRTTTTPTSTSSGKSGFKKTLDWLGKGMPGTDEWKAKPGLGVADIPLGAGKLITGLQEAKKGNIWGGLGHAASGGVELGFTIASAFTGKPITRRNTVIQPATKINTSQLFTAAEDFNLAKIQKATGSYTPGVRSTSSAITGANNPTSMPVLPKFPPKSIASSAQANASARMAALQNASAVPVNAPKSTPSKPKVTKPTPVTTPTASVSPPVTIPMNYLSTGTRVGEFKQWRPGDPKPAKPRYSKSTDTTDLQIDYEIRLAEYNKYNPKKK